MSTGPAWSDRELRLRRVRDRLHEERLDGLLVSRPQSVRWLTGFSGSAGFLLIEPGAVTLVTDFRYRTQASDETADAVAVVVAESDLFEAVGDCLRASGTGPRLGFEDQHLTIRDRRALGEACGGVMWESTADLIADLRAVKDDAEIASTEQAVRLAEQALDEVVGSIRPGLTERELAADLVHALLRRGSESLAFDPIVAFGERSALPHARPGDRRLAEGDLVLVDFGAVADGYCSDMTRVFVAGSAAPWQAALHSVVREAVERALEATAAGVPARDVDRAARDVIATAGFGERFGHGTGHGVGLEVHEAPRVNARSRDTLAAGNVVTIEPGVYLPGRGGVRLEELVLVEDDGGRVLTRYPMHLQEL